MSKTRRKKCHRPLINYSSIWSYRFFKSLFLEKEGSYQLGRTRLYFKIKHAIPRREAPFIENFIFGKIVHTLVHEFGHSLTASLFTSDHKDIYVYLRKDAGSGCCRYRGVTCGEDVCVSVGGPFLEMLFCGGQV